jgi:ADP-ribosyl-[dinitrogen reductase] hydrolase
MVSGQILKRTTNCLYGAAIGDALGGRYEFDEGALLDNDLRQYKDTFLPILGGGVWNLQAGQVTDDTEMAMALAASIIETNKISADSIAKWYHLWYLSKPFDIGESTLNAVKHNSAQEMIKAAKDRDSSLSEPSLSNGMLMRIAPLAISLVGFIYRNSLMDHGQSISEIVRLAAREDTQLTHSSEEALCYSSAYLLLLTYAILDGNIRRAIKLIHNEWKQYHNIGDWYEIFCAGLDIEGSRLAHSPKVKIGDSRIAFQLAVRKGYLVSTRSMTFTEALISTIQLGGDTDTNACIVGALCGAMSVDTEIPNDWKQTIKNARPTRYNTWSPNKYLAGLTELSEGLLVPK